MARYAQCLVWIDLEGTGLDPDEDEILEVAMFITDFDLQPLPRTKFNKPIQLTSNGASRIRENEYVKNMHAKSGLIAATRSPEALSREDAEAEMLRILKEETPFEKGEFMIAGSGVLHYDKMMLASQFPYFNDQLAYYGFDVGVLRRGLLLLNHGVDVIEPVEESFQDGVKTHRAWDDITAHYKEARRFKDWLGGLPR